jgi:hypothetical protein
MMLIRKDPRWILVIGFVLVLIGAVLPWLMVMQVIRSTFFINFFSFGCTVAGLLLGIVGAAYYARPPKDQ